MNTRGPSGAPYIIICSGRIDRLYAASPSKAGGIIKAASDAARNLVTYYGDRLKAEDTQPISDLQHDMMENIHTWSNTETEAKVDEMFALLYALEDKY